MPEISRFKGVIINRYHESGRHQHPQFPARYSEYRASFSIEPPGLLAGTLPRRQLNLTLAWAELHQTEWMENWQHVVQDLPPQKIEGQILRATMETYQATVQELHDVIWFRIEGDYLIRVKFDDETEQHASRELDDYFSGMA